ncbi:MAG: hypothetical protein EA348_00450, partial [Pseudomonadaceae bacterium]
MLATRPLRLALVIATALSIPLPLTLAIASPADPDPVGSQLSIGERDRLLEAAKRSGRDLLITADPIIARSEPAAWAVYYDTLGLVSEDQSEQLRQAIERRYPSTQVANTRNGPGTGTLLAGGAIVGGLAAALGGGGGGGG